MGSVADTETPHYWKKDCREFFDFTQEEAPKESYFWRNRV
jgi:hypothetical protein